MLKSKMLPKSSEGVNAKKTTDSSSKGSIRTRGRKLEGASAKDKIETTTRISTTLIRTRSYEKNIKPGTAPSKKTTDVEEKKNVRSKSASERQKPPPKDPGIDVLEKVALASKINASTPPKYPQKNEPPPNKAEFGKLKIKGFTQLLPLCERELKKIETAWVNTVYCSLSMRANLVKFLIHSFPNIEKSQFYTEDKKLIQCFDQVRVSTKTEADNLLHIVKSLLAVQEETRDNYQNMMKSDKDLRKKILQTGEDCKLYKAEVAEAQKKKEAAEAAESEKPKKSEAPTKKRDFLSYFSFGSHQNSNAQKHNETPPKPNTPTIAEESNETKTETVKLTSLQDNLNALKAKYLYENETYEKKIKDLETLLEEKIKTLKQEREVKNQLQTCLNQFQAQQKRLGKAFGYEQLDYLVRPSTHGRDKRREDLWLTAIKLILKGFFIQLKNLEMERDKMLFQLQSNDTENFNTLAASIIHKDNFVKSIKQQMISINKAYQKRKNREN